MINRQLMLECFRLVIRHYCRTPRVSTLAPERPLILYFLLLGRKVEIVTPYQLPL